MWAATANPKIPIPLGDVSIQNWNNSQLLAFIKKHRGSCNEFDKAIAWLGDRNYKEVIRDCPHFVWLNWLNENLKAGELVAVTEIITITHGRDEKYALWRNGIWDLSEDYVDLTTIKIISQ